MLNLIIQILILLFLKMSSSWIEKYRPKHLKNIIGQNNIISTIKNMIKNNYSITNLLFYGMPGTGKTTTILSLCYELFGPNNFKNRVLELNASDERGIGVVRDSILRFAKTSLSSPDPNYPSPPIKLIILDEADAMTYDAQSALRKIMEDYLETTRFCIICNYIEKIIKPIVSRCMFFNFIPLDNKLIIRHLKKIAEKEKLKLNDEDIENIYKSYNGDLRQAISSLQQLKYIDIEDLEDEIMEKFNIEFYDNIYKKMQNMDMENKIKYFENNAFDKNKYRDYLIMKFSDNQKIVKHLIKYNNVFDY